MHLKKNKICPVYKSLDRSISGDSKLTISLKVKYLIQGVVDFIFSLFEKNISKQSKLTTEDIGYLFSIGKGKNNASPQRIYYRNLCAKLRNLSKNKKLQIIDIGCGRGSYSDVFKKCSPGSEYHGYDIKHHREWQSCVDKKDNLNRRFFVNDLSDIKNLQTIPGKYDLSVSFSALEHVEKIQQTINTLYQISAKNSMHYHAIPTHGSLFQYLTHGFRRFSSGSAKYLFEKAGFENVDVYQYGGCFSFMLFLACKNNIFLFMAMRCNIADVEKLLNRIYQRFIIKAIIWDQHVQILPVCYVVEAQKCRN